MTRTTGIIVIIMIAMIGCAPAPALVGQHQAALEASGDGGGGADMAAPQPDGGCDPQQWQTSCGPGLVCASDGTCGPPCGNGNVVCDPTTLCTAQADCVPPCRDATGAVIALDPLAPGQSCTGAGYLEPQDHSAACILPCFWALCTSPRHGYGGGC